MLKDLKAFLFQGNVIDLAVAVIFGAAFKSIIDSLVADLITPLLLTPALKAAGADKISELSWNGVTYGNFLSAVINFLIIGTILFFIVKAAEKAFPKKVEKPAPSGPTQEELLTEIRDLLKQK